jgi:F0F1-type ATP synthase membrane subunit c/vacuolar-type H+-ATPase subunit K
MIDILGNFFHYMTIALTVCISSLSAGLGQGLTGRAAIIAANKQPNAYNDIFRATILGSALIETTALLGFIIALILLVSTPNEHAFETHLAELGICFAIGISSLVVGYAASLPAQQACNAIARQPFFADNIIRFMLITQSLIQTPIIFSFIIAFLIRYKTAEITGIAESLSLLAAGLCLGLGSIGPVIGLGRFAREACNGIGINRAAYPNIMSFSIISLAIIETPILFSLLVALMLLLTAVGNSMFAAICALGAAFCMGFGTVGPGIASSRTATAACRQIALNPAMHGTLSAVSMFGQGIIDTCAIYSFVIAIFLIFFV